MNRTVANRIYIIGAGFAGQTLTQELQSKAIFGEVVAFLDDDPAKIGQLINGIPVLGPIRDVARLLRMHNADEAIIAIPSASREYLRELYGILKRAGFQRIKILPGISQILEGDAHLIQTRSIDTQDLLGRTPVAVSLKKSLAYLRAKRVLVTGAGGSIGGELARQLLSGGAQRLYLLGHGENSIYQIDHELRLLQEAGVGEKATIVPIVGDLKDQNYIDYILPKLKVNVIFHAAAYKHVPMMEANPVAAIDNNVFGTNNLIQAALSNQVERFVLISTDKAVNPVSVYGVSKFICERLTLQAAANSQGHFMVVRFGNVLGSRGSIIPLFQRQIEKGGPVTVTHPQSRRWFMTIPEACSLVLTAGGVGENAKLYLLDMGEPIRIKDLAEQMIRFYGYEPDKEIKIEFIGLRPGERLSEALWSQTETPLETGYPRIRRIERHDKTQLNLDQLLKDLRPVCQLDPEQPAVFRDQTELRTILQRSIPTVMLASHERSF